MPHKPKNDNEAIDLILAQLFSEGVPYWTSDKMLDDIFDSSYRHEIDRILRKMKKLDLIQFHEKKVLGLFQITDSAREILNEYGSYRNYVSSKTTIKRKEEKRIFFDRILKNGNLIAALLISAAALILSQCPTNKDRDQKKIEEGIQSLSKKLDSLLQVLPMPQKQTEPPLVKDTVPSK